MSLSSCGSSFFCFLEVYAGDTITAQEGELYVFDGLFNASMQFKQEEKMNYRSLIERSRKFMEAAGSNVTKFCARCGLSTSLFYRWEAGETPISDDKAAAIERFLESFGY